MKLKYSILISWSEEDKAFLAQVPEFPVCTAEGPTRAEALVNSEVSVQNWIEAARAIGKERHALEKRKFSNTSRSDAYIKKLSEYWDGIPT